jgi:hypothetical protein
VGGLLKWFADRIAARRKLSAPALEQVEQRGTLLASGFIAGEAILAIVLSVAFIAADRLFDYPEFSVTRLLTGEGELGLFTQFGAPLSLVVFAAVAYVLIRGPFRKGLAQ